MKLLNSALIAIVLSSVTTICDNLNDAIDISIKTKQNILIIFTTDHCVFCNTLKKEVVDQNIIENHIVCILDAEQYKKIARQFKVRLFPTTIQTNSDLEESNRFIGYKKDQYIEWLQRLENSKKVEVRD